MIIMEKMIKSSCLVLCFCIIFISKSFAQQYTIIHQKNEISFSKENDYDVISLQGCFFSTETGKPMLPVQALKYVIPLDKDVSNIKIIQIEEAEIDGNYIIAPTQPPMRAQKYTASLPIVKDTLFYRTDTFYPQQLFYEIETGFMAGTRICSFNFSPVRYNPLTQKIKLITKIVFEFEYKADIKSFCSSSALSETSRKKIQENIKSIINNPSDFTSRSALSLKNAPQQLMANTTETGTGISGIDYVIITNDSLSSGFQEIADWKKKTGLPSKVVTTEWIYKNFSGADGAEEIRSFIRYAFEQWGSIWFLIGGDPEIVPVRKVWVGQFDTIQLPPTGSFIPTDMYYACLDGNWNADGDVTFGEGSYNRNNDGTSSSISTTANIDDVDRFYDVFVGRVPIKTIQELNNYKMKYFNYVKNPTNNVTNAFLFSRNSDVFSTSAMDNVKLSFSSNISVDRFYECTGSSTYCCGTKSDVLNALNGVNKKYHIVCGYGHGSVVSFDACESSISRDEISNLQNYNNTGMILYNNHCETLTWDHDCVGRRFMVGSNGGIAYIGNTNYGWTGDPSRYNKPFIYNLYNDGDSNIGKSFFNAKGSGSITDNTSRWGFFALNIAADPEMQVWTDVPKTLNVTVFPTSIQAGQRTVNVTVSNLQLKDTALICVEKGTEVYEIQTVGANNTYTIPVTTETAGTMYITVTAHNYFPVENSVQITASATANPVIQSVNFVDNGTNGSIGNGNGQNDAGETICLQVGLKNNGGTTANNLTATLGSTSGYINVLNNSSIIGSIASNSTVVAQFLYKIDSVAPEILSCAFNPVQFNLDIKDASNTVWTKTFNIDVFATDLQQCNKIISNSGSSSFDMQIELQNLGKAPATGLTGRLFYNSDSIAVAFPAAIGYLETQSSNTIHLPIHFDSTLVFNLKVNNSYGKMSSFKFNLSKPHSVTGLQSFAKEREIDLLWDSVPGVSGYNIYRCKVDTTNGNELGSYVRLNSVPVTFTFYNDADSLKPLTKYYYKVHAVSQSGMESDSVRILAWTSYPTQGRYPIVMDALTGSQMDSHFVAEDVNNDGKKEIFTALYANDSGRVGDLIALDWEGSELFHIKNNITIYSGFYNLNTAIRAGVAIADINQDGINEIVSVTRGFENNNTNNKITCHIAYDNNDDQQPDTLWQIPTQRTFMSGAIIDNLDNSPDGSMEVVVVPDGNTDIPYRAPQIYNAQGTLIQELPIENDDYTYAAPAVADLDGYGNKEIIEGYYNRSGGPGGLYIWRQDGTSYGKNNPFLILSGYRFASSPVVCDINGDGKKEILLSAFSTFHRDSCIILAIDPNAVDSSKVLLPGWGIASTDSNFYTASEVSDLSKEVAVGDLYGDGKLEVVAVGVNCIKIWNNDGKLINTINVQGLSSVFRSPLLADIDGDNEAEIIVTSMTEGKIYGYKSNGSSVIGFPLETDQPFVRYATPVVADLDGDGKSEIAAGTGEDKKIYVWKTNGNPDRIEWGSARHDARNTGEYFKICPKTIIDSDTVWNSNIDACNDIIVNSGTLTLSSACVLNMNESTLLIVRPGANLVIDGGKILNANVRALPQSSVTIKNKGYVKLRKRGKFSILRRATFDYQQGSIDVTQ